MAEWKPVETAPMTKPHARDLTKLQDMRRKLVKMHTELRPMATKAPGIVDAMASLRMAFGCLARARLELGYDGGRDG